LGRIRNRGSKGKVVVLQVVHRVRVHKVILKVALKVAVQVVRTIKPKTVVRMIKAVKTSLKIYRKRVKMLTGKRLMMRLTVVLVV
jgi:hypothetical protein